MIAIPCCEVAHAAMKRHVDGQPRFTLPGAAFALSASRLERTELIL